LKGLAKALLGAGQRIEPLVQPEYAEDAETRTYNGLTHDAEGRQGTVMKLKRAGAFAGCLMLFPQIGMAQEEITWRSAQPAWKASAPASPAKSIEPQVIQLCAAESEPTEQLPMPRQSDADEVRWRRSPPTTLPPVGSGSTRLGRPTLGADGLPELSHLPIAPPPRQQGLSVYQRDVEEPTPPKIMPPDVAPVSPNLVVPPVKPLAAQASVCPPRPAQQPILPRLFGKSPDESYVDIAANEDAKAADPAKPRLQVSGDYLFWWSKGDHVPVLASTGTPESVGILGQPGTRTLFGPGSDNLGDRSGGRFRALFWFDDKCPYGVEGSFLFLGNQGSSFTATSNQYPVLSRPVFVVNNNQENAETVAFPNFSTGALAIDTHNQLWGADVNLFRRLCGTCDRTIDVFAGYKYLNMSESIDITEGITAGVNAPDPVGTFTAVRDSFATRNIFNGGQIGAAFEQRHGSWFVNARASVGFGVNDETVDVVGNQFQLRPGQPPTVFTGGLLAAQSNIGSYSRDRFSVVPDFALNLGYQFTPNLRAYVGYSFLYWTNVVRPGEQIDRNVNLNFIPNAPPVSPGGPRVPAVPFQTSDFWAQGVNFGIEWRY
jgi:Putative beta barrel porin-7 (BBP7)